MIRFAVVLALVGAAFGCPGKGGEIVPGLPGDGTGHFVDGQRPGGATSPEAPDPWAGRDLIEAPPPAEPRAVELPAVERFTLKNGLEVIAVRDPALPVVSMQLAVKAGKALEPRDKVGLSEFAAAMLTRGVRGKSAAEIARAIDFVGGSLGASASYEATLVSCKALSKDLNTCLTLLPEVVARPTFPEDEMKIVRGDLHALVRQRKDDAGQLANAHFQTFLWGAEHARGWPLSARTIDSITRDDLVAWHGRWIRPNNAVLAVAGNLDTKALQRQLERAFRRWKKADLPERPRYQLPKLDGLRVLLVDKPDQTQSHLRIGHFGLSHKDEAFYAAMVMNYSLGGGAFSSRLLETVRSSEGKSYSASSSFDRNLDVGAFVAATFTRTPETVETVQLVRDVIAKMAAEGPTPAEVASAVQNLAGSYAMRFETGADVAGALLAADLHELGPEYVRDYPLRIAAVTPDDAKKVAARLLDPDDAVIVIVGNAAKLEPQLQEAGWTYDKVGYLEPVAPWERQAAVAAAAEPVDPEAEAAARQLLDAALAKKGGAKRLAGLKSLSWKGKAELSLGGAKAPAEVQKRLRPPDALRLDMNIAGGQVVATTVLAGDQAWGREVSPRGDKSLDFTGAELASLKTQMWREQDLVLLRHREKGAKVTPLPDREIAGRPHHAIRVTNADGTRTVVLFIDKKSKLLGGMEFIDQGVKATETYSDYRQVAGLQIAHRRVTESPQLGLSIEIASVKVDAKLPPALFSRPGAAKKKAAPAAGESATP